MPKIPHLCFLTFDPGTLASTRFAPFFQGLRDLGYVDGQSIAIDYLSADGQGERFPASARMPRQSNVLRAFDQTRQTARAERRVLRITDGDAEANNL
jgi:hypothetical protein